MDGFAGQGILEGAIDHLVLFHFGLVGKGGGNDHGFQVISTSKVIDHYLGIGQGRLDLGFNLLKADHSFFWMLSAVGMLATQWLFDFYFTRKLGALP